MNRPSSNPSRENILLIAKDHIFYVHLYAPESFLMRRLTKRMAAAGELVLIGKTRTHAHYRTPQEKKK